MAKVIKRGGHNPDSVFVAGKLVLFDAHGVAEVTDEEQLAILREIADSTGQYVIEEEKKEEKVKEEKAEEEASKKRAVKKKSE